MQHVMENAPQNFYDLAQQMLLNGHRKEQILDELQRKGAKQDVLEKITEHIIKHKSGKRLSNGFAALIIGALFLLSSFFLTLFASYTHFSTSFILYGLTTIGICVVMYGLYLIFD